MIDIYRFSEDGFIPKYQSKIVGDVLYWRDFKDFGIVPKHLIKHFETTVEKAKTRNIDEIKYSVFSFIRKPDKSISNFLLNHLSNEEYNKRKWYKGIIPKHVTVFADSDIVGKIKNLDKFVLGDLLNLYPWYDSVIIPELSIKFINDVECLGIVI